MRYIDPTSEPVPAAINYSTIAAPLDELLNTLARKASGSVYRGETRAANVITKTVVQALKRKYKNKCGYCENIEYEPCVEHHRPIGSVTGGLPDNKGYYWLAYEWTNMVSACDACNQPPYKGIKFPVTAVLCNSLPPILANGTYDFQQFRYSSFYNSGEGPLILHPEYCLHPELHFSFDTSGNIYHRTSQGQHSISVYGLDRPNLNVWRKEIYDDYLGDLKVLVRSRFKTVMPKNEAWFTEGVLRLFQKIRDRRYDEDRSFTLFTTYLFKHPTIFFISPFPVAEVRRQLHFAITAAFRTMAGLP